MGRRLRIIHGVFILVEDICSDLSYKTASLIHRDIYSKMARLRPRSSPTLGFWGIVGLVLLVTLTLGVAASSSASSAPSQPSPAVDVELICPTRNPNECYPKIFSPTDEFQTLHDDQDIPPGLHVRMNVWTGEKEAKINVPDEQNTALEGLPVEKSVVIVEPNESEEEEIHIPPGAPVYEAAGAIKEPPKSGESVAFYDSLEILRKGLDVDQALEDLEELSHDIYYGLKIAEDYETVKNLFCLANSKSIFDENPDPVVMRRARLAALALAGTLQNNAKALNEVEKHWPTLSKEMCPGFVKDDEAGVGALRLVSAQFDDEKTNDPSVTKARASAINGLLKIDAIREELLKRRGMGGLLEVLVSEMGPEWESAKRKVAQLVQDNFLDETMGAKLGEWPVNDQHSDKQCKNLHGVDQTRKCWDWEARRLSEENKGDNGHWSHELWRQLKEARKGVKTERTEL